MRNRTTEWLIVVTIVLLFLALCYMLVQEQDRNILPQHPSSAHFSTADRAYLAEHEEMSIFVEPEL